MSVDCLQAKTLFSGFLFLCAGMRLVVNPGQMLEIQVGIDLRGADVGMPEQFLHGAQIATGLE